MIKVIELEIESPSYWLGLNFFKKWSWKDLNVFKPRQLFTTVWYFPYVEDPISEQGYKCFWRLIKAARHRIYAIILFEGSRWLSEPLQRASHRLCMWKTGPLFSKTLMYHPIKVQAPTRGAESALSLIRLQSLVEAVLVRDQTDEMHFWDPIEIFQPHSKLICIRASLWSLLWHL